MNKPKLGATGQFPRGKFAEHDEGELALAMGVKDKTLIINFGKSVAWVGLDLASAECFAELLAKNITKLKGTK